MDNATRSERSRGAVIEAALTIIARDGPGRLTLDAIARESGISKGGVMHQFPTKKAVLSALLDLQVEHYEAVGARYLAEHRDVPQPHLKAQIATIRAAVTDTRPLGLAILGAVSQDPSLLDAARASAASVLEAIKAEAPDPQLATLRWLAARGLVFSGLLGLCPFSPEERETLLDRLGDDRHWPDAAVSPDPVDPGGSDSG
jgi:AcrR family transcriptional regulator